MDFSPSARGQDILNRVKAFIRDEIEPVEPQFWAELNRVLGVSFVAFSPVARGFLCGPLDVNAFDAKDIRRTMPRFTPANHARNQALLPSFNAIASEVGCTPSQLAIAWLLHQGDDILPIPGTTSVEHLLDDLGAANVRLSPEVLARLDAQINQNTVSGDRYSDQANREVDTEGFAAS